MRSTLPSPSGPFPTPDVSGDSCSRQAETGYDVVKVGGTAGAQALFELGLELLFDPWVGVVVLVEGKPPDVLVALRHLLASCSAMAQESPSGCAPRQSQPAS